MPPMSFCRPGRSGQMYLLGCLCGLSWYDVYLSRQEFRRVDAKPSPMAHVAEPYIKPAQDRMHWALLSRFAPKDFCSNYLQFFNCRGSEIKHCNLGTNKKKKNSTQTTKQTTQTKRQPLSHQMGERTVNTANAFASILVLCADWQRFSFRCPSTHIEG